MSFEMWMGIMYGLSTLGVIFGLWLGYKLYKKFGKK